MLCIVRVFTDNCSSSVGLWNELCPDINFVEVFFLRMTHFILSVSVEESLFGIIPLNGLVWAISFVCCDLSFLGRNLITQLQFAYTKSFNKDSDKASLKRMNLRGDFILIIFSLPVGDKCHLPADVLSIMIYDGRRILKWTFLLALIMLTHFL